VLTALGLAVGVGLVVTVTALSKGLDDAQSKVLKPLTGVGTDMSVTRPLNVSGAGSRSELQRGPGAGPGRPVRLSPSEQNQLRKEERPTAHRPPEQGEAGAEVLRRPLRHHPAVVLGRREESHRGRAGRGGVAGG